MSPLSRIEPSKAVLVTGASSGIGRNVTEALASRGHFVYAGARRDADLEALSSLKNVQALRLDVTDPSHIAAALKLITQAGRGLYGLVNNAGIAAFGSVLDTSESELERVLAVNVFGPYRMTREFVPLIAAQAGRIVMIGSIAGILAERNLSAYSMSKHAIEALTDSVASELESSSISVSIVEPGRFRTELVNNAIARTGSERALTLSDCKAPDDVTVAVGHALFAERPKRRYLVVSNQLEAQRTIWKQMTQLVQLNEEHLYSYQREELIEMFDKALAPTRV